MNIYLVRHGSTTQVENRICQQNTEPLNDLGRQQAQALAARFKKVHLDLVVSSPHTRAIQTAQAITPHVTVSDLFVEVRKPSEVIGKPKDTDFVKDILQKIGDMYAIDPSWHYSDEENYEDLKKRGLSALEYLIAQNKDNVLVVSHGNFIGILAALMVFGQDLDVISSLKLKNFLRLSNTGVSICTYEDARWKLLCWNDSFHLLE